MGPDGGGARSPSGRHAGDLDLMKMRVNERPTAGFPQIYILDPDRNVIEINAERLDL
jgi:hypothetical protein